MLDRVRAFPPHVLYWIALVVVLLFCVILWLVYLDRTAPWHYANFQGPWAGWRVSLDTKAVPPLPQCVSAAEFPFRRRVATINNLRVHFVDDGNPNGARSILFIHGNPTWSYMWRKVIAEIKATQSSVRIVAVDLIGFGLSDKPELGFHSLERHVTVVSALVEALNLLNITVVGQDWGGPIAAGVAMSHFQRVSSALFTNTATYAPREGQTGKLFHKAARVPLLSDVLFRGLNFPLPFLGRVQHQSSSIKSAAYSSVFPGWGARAGPLALARMIPTARDTGAGPFLAAIESWAGSFQGRVALVWGLADPILGRSIRVMRRVFPSASVLEVPQAGHFSPEEAYVEIANALLSLVR